MVNFRFCMLLWFSRWPKMAYEISGWQYISTWMVSSDSGLLVNLTSWPSILWKRPWTPKLPGFVASAGLSCRLLAVRRFLLQRVNDGLHSIQVLDWFADWEGAQVLCTANLLCDLLDARLRSRSAWSQHTAGQGSIPILRWLVASQCCFCE